MRAKGTKTRLGRSPLRTSLGYEAVNMSSLCSARYPCCGSCHCHHTRPLWQLALWLGGFHLRAFPGEAAFPPPSARPPAESCRGGACPSRISQGNSRRVAGRASPAPTPSTAQSLCAPSRAAQVPTVEYTISCVQNITQQYMLIFVRGRAIMKEHRPRGGNRKHREERGLCTK